MKLKAEQLKTPEGIAVITSFLTGFLAHHFALTNVLHNYDDIGQMPTGYGTGITSGRWLLSLMGDFFQAIGGNYNLPFFNGLLFLAIIAVAAGFFVSVFHIRGRVFSALIGMLFAVFPSVTSTMFFRYTSVYYGIALLLVVLAAWVFDRYKYGIVLSAIFVSLSLGIYQGYVPLTISMFVLKLIQRALEGETSFWMLIQRGFLYCISLIMGLLLYYGLLNIFLHFYDTSLSNYNGINTMGQIALKDLPKIIYKAVYLFCMMPVKDYCGLANMLPLRLGYFLIAGVTIIIAAYILLVKIRKISILLITGVLCLLFPIAVNFIVVMSGDIWIYTLMVHAFVIVPCVPIVVCECLPDKTGDRTDGKVILNRCISVVLSVMVLCYAYTANINYTAMYYSNRQIENYLNSLVIQVRMTDGYETDKEWAFIGEPDDPLLKPLWDYEMSYGGIFPTFSQLHSYTRWAWIWQYLGLQLPTADEKSIDEISQMEDVKQMPCWPDQGSIKVIDNTVVIKFQNLEE